MITINKSNATFIVHSLRTSPGGAFQWEHSAPNTLNQQNAINQQNCTPPHNYSLSRCCSRIHGCITMRSGWQMNAACYMLIAHTRPWVSVECVRESEWLFFFTWSAWNSLRWWFIFTARSVAVVAELPPLFCRTLLSRARRRLRWLRTKIVAAINHLFIVARVQ